MSTPFPPPGYVATESAVSGIEVYKPASPSGEGHREVVTFQCPQCAAQTAYSIADGGLICTHCGFYEPPTRPTVGKGAAAFEFTVEVVERAAHGWGIERKELACQHCGARTSVPADSLSDTCPFCASNRVIQQAAPQDELRPRFLVPFQVDPPAARSIARTWLSSSWMTPRALHHAAGRAEFNPVYLPFWTFDSATHADWRAEVGREKKKADGEKEIRWRWERGQTGRHFEDLLIQGTTQVSSRLLGQVRPFDLAQLAPYEPAYLAGLQAQAYDTPLDTAWQSARHHMREQTKEACRAEALADDDAKKLRNFSMTLDFADESWRYILLPLFVAAYQHGGKSYQVIINGQSGAIAGQRPVDWLRVLLALAALLLPGPLLFLLATRWLAQLSQPLAAVAWMLAMLWMLLGLVATIAILGKAVRLDDA